MRVSTIFPIDQLERSSKSMCFKLTAQHRKPIMYDSMISRSTAPQNKFFPKRFFYRFTNLLHLQQLIKQWIKKKNGNNSMTTPSEPRLIITQIDSIPTVSKFLLIASPNSTSGNNHSYKSSVGIASNEAIYIKVLNMDPVFAGITQSKRGNSTIICWALIISHKYCIPAVMKRLLTTILAATTPEVAPLTTAAAF